MLRHLSSTEPRIAPVEALSEPGRTGTWYPDAKDDRTATVSADASIALHCHVFLASIAVRRSQ